MPKITPEWEKLRDYIVNIIHELVSSEVARVHEEKAGAVRRDGGRLLNEEIQIKRIIEAVSQSQEEARKEWSNEGSRELIEELLSFLPDSYRYKYAWDECLEKEQDAVKEVREKANKFLQALSTSEEEKTPKCFRCNDNGCPACDGSKGSKYNPEPY